MSIVAVHPGIDKSLEAALPGSYFLYGYLPVFLGQFPKSVGYLNFYQMGLAGTNGILKRLAQLTDVGDLCAFKAIRLEEFDEVRVHQVGGKPSVLAEPVPLKPLQHAPGVVIEHQNHRVDAVLGASGKFLEIVLEPAVTGHADHRAIRLANLGADRRREGEAQAKPAVGMHVRSRVVNV